MNAPVAHAVMAMTRADLPEIATLFFKAFRKGGTPPADFVGYIEQLFFGSPIFSPDTASLVHRLPDGTLDSAMLVLPTAVSVNGRVLTARLMSNYMTDPQRRTRGGAALALTIRARSQDLCFTDSANHVSTDHWKALGGHMLPPQSLDFRRVFRPTGFYIARLSRRLGPLAAPARAAAGIVDVALRRLRPTLAAPQGSGQAMTRAEFIATAPDLVSRFAVHPLWSADEMAWLLDMAALNTVSGQMQMRAIRDKLGSVVACALFYAQKGKTARVLNLLARPGCEATLVADLLGHLDAMGCLGVEGMAQGFLMEALSRQPGVSFHPRGFCFISTRHAEIVDAAQRGDIYLGGLTGEDWSRLVTDFHD